MIFRHASRLKGASRFAFEALPQPRPRGEIVAWDGLDGEMASVESKRLPWEVSVSRVQRSGKAEPSCLDLADGGR